jgi:hypothetical protein
MLANVNDPWLTYPIFPRKVDNRKKKKGKTNEEGKENKTKRVRKTRTMCSRQTGKPIPEKQESSSTC